MYLFLKYLVNFYYRIIYRVEIIGTENIPKDVGIIIAPNHTYYADPIIMGVFFPGHLFLMAKKELFKNKLFANFLTFLGGFPVDRDGIGISAIKKSLKILKNKNPLLVFPEGTRNSLKGKEHSDAKAGIALIAIRAKVNIVPVTIDSNFKFFSKLRIIYHPVVKLDGYFESKFNSADYTIIANDILNTIYNVMELR